ncbi:predicted protein [Botrytis cinerea T4]|uniref:Uncharacterized protein n=1 Tax=Botryotinia fuckeliana (strain T4) TaxID=999810 RepID=G2Y8C0_BOTF4|nr:predicted protein [Botrytis cinerea T4]
MTADNTLLADGFAPAVQCSAYTETHLRLPSTPTTKLGQRREKTQTREVSLPLTESTLSANLPTRCIFRVVQVWW